MPLDTKKKKKKKKNVITRFAKKCPGTVAVVQALQGLVEASMVAYCHCTITLDKCNFPIYSGDDDDDDDVVCLEELHDV
jgi:hypothetical protein